MKVFTPEFRRLMRKERPNLVQEIMMDVMFNLITGLLGMVLGMALMASILK